MWPGRDNVLTRILCAVTSLALAASLVPTPAWSLPDAQPPSLDASAGGGEEPATQSDSDTGSLSPMAQGSSLYPVTGDDAEVRVQVTFESEGVTLLTRVVRAGDVLEPPQSPASSRPGKAFAHWEVAGSDISARLGRTLTPEDITALSGGTTADAESLHHVTADASFVDGHTVRFHQYSRQQCREDSSLTEIMSYVCLASGTIDLSLASRIFTPLVEGVDAQLVGWEAYATPEAEMPSATYTTDATIDDLAADFDLYPTLSAGFRVKLDTGEGSPLIDDLFVQDAGSGLGTLPFASLPTEETLAGDSYDPETHEFDPAYRGWRQGWTLEGWYSDAELEHRIDADFTIAADTTVFAKWLPRTDTTYNIVNLMEGDDGGPGEGTFGMLSAVEQTGTTGVLTDTQGSSSPLSYYHRATPEELASRPDLTGWEEQTISGDGLTSVNVYWFRNRYNLRLTTRGGAVVFGPKLVKYGELEESYDPSRGIERYIYWNLQTRAFGEGESTSTPHTYWNRPQSIPGMLGVVDGSAVNMVLSEGTCRYAKVTNRYMDLLDGEEPSPEAKTLNLSAGTFTFELDKTVNDMRAQTHGINYYKVIGSGGGTGQVAITNGSPTPLDRSGRTADWQEDVYGYTLGGDAYTLYYDTYHVRNRYHLSFGNCAGSPIDAEHLAGYDIQYGQYLRKYAPDFDASTKRNQGGVTYAFRGWYSDAFAAENWQLPTSDAFAIDLSSATMIDSDYTLYAAWEPETYDVTFDANGGTLEPSEGATLSPDATSLTYADVESGSLLTRPATPTRIEGGIEYTFAGWFRDPGLTDPWNFTSSTVQGTTTLYAKWVRGRTCKVSYHTAAGSAIPGMDDLTYTYGARVAVAPAPTDPTQTEPFMGWSTVRDNTARLVGPSFAITSNTDLFAVYGTALPNARPEDAEEGAPALTLVSNYPPGAGGEELITTLQAARANASVTLPVTVAGDKVVGYHVVGWSENRDGTGATFLPGEAVAVAVPSTLYAQWEANQLSATLDASFTYDGSAHEPAPSVVGWDGASLTPNTDYTLAYEGNVDAGTAHVIVTGSGDYALSNPVTLEFSIAPRPTTITLSDKASKMGQDVADLTYDVSPPLVVADHLGTIAPYTANAAGDRVAIDTNATGTYQILADYEPNANYAVTVVAGTYTVSAATLLVTARGFSGTYDGQPHQATVTLSPPESTAAGARVYYATVPLTAENYEASGQTTPPQLTDAGNTTVYYYVRGTDEYQPDADAVTGSREVAIARAPLTVTANPAQVLYGDAADNEGVSFSGFVVGDDEDDLGGLTPTYTYNARPDGSGDAYEPGRPVGTYYIRPSGPAEAGNYALTYRAGTLSVVRRVASLSWSDADRLPYTGEARIYAGATVTNLLAGDVVTVDAMGNSEIHAGSYTAIATGLAGIAASNYALPAEGLSHEWHVTKAANAASVSVDDWTYGEAHALPTVTAGFGVEGAVVEYSTTEDGPYSPDSPTSAGTYWARARIEGTSDYEGITSPAVSLTVSPRPVRIEGVSAQDKVYDGTAAAIPSGSPALAAVPGVAESGPLPTDDLTVASGSATFASAAAGEGLQVSFDGFSLAGASASNYVLEGQPHATTADITPRPLRIAANDARVTYQDDAPTYTATFDSFAPGEDASILTGALSLACTYLRGSSAGTYQIRPSGLTTNGNYDITYQDGTLTVDRATNEWTVAPAIASWILGQEVPTPVARSRFGEPYLAFAPASALDPQSRGPQPVVSLDAQAEDPWSPDLPTTPGSYVMRATVDEATNWTGLTALVPFTVSADTLTYLPNSKIASGDTPTFEGATGDVATVEKSGYDWPDHRFVGWNTKPDGTGDAYAPGGEYRLGPGEDVLYAQWDPVGELAYDGNGADDGSMSTRPGRQGESVTVAACGFTREGFVFASWNTEPDGSGQTYAPGDTIALSLGGDILYAQWEVVPDPTTDPSPEPSSPDETTTDPAPSDVVASLDDGSTNARYRKTGAALMPATGDPLGSVAPAIAMLALASLAAAIALRIRRARL